MLSNQEAFFVALRARGLEGFCSHGLRIVGDDINTIIAYRTAFQIKRDLGLLTGLEGLLLGAIDTLVEELPLTYALAADFRTTAELYHSAWKSSRDACYTGNENRSDEYHAEMRKIGTRALNEARAYGSRTLEEVLNAGIAKTKNRRFKGFARRSLTEVLGKMRAATERKKRPEALSAPAGELFGCFSAHPHS